METMRRLERCLFVVLSGALVGCTHHQPAPVVPQASPEETIAVYSAVVDDMYILPRHGSGHRLQQIVVEDSTVRLHSPYFESMLRDTAAFRSRMRHEVPGAPPELLTTFLALNATQAELPAFLAVGNVAVRPLSAAEVKEAFAPSPEDIPDSRKTWDQVIHDTLKGWAPFYRRYPNSQGLLTLSRVCFDQTRQWALVYAGNQFAGLGGRGYLIVLRRVGQTWQVQAKIGLWTS